MDNFFGILKAKSGFTLKPTDGLVVRDEIIARLDGRAVHAVRGADEDARGVGAGEDLAVVVAVGRGQAFGGEVGLGFVALGEGHAALLGPKRHRGVVRLAREGREGAVAGVVEAVVPDDAALDPAVLGTALTAARGPVGPAGLDPGHGRQRRGPVRAAALPPVEDVHQLHRRRRRKRALLENSRMELVTFSYIV